MGDGWGRVAYSRSSLQLLEMKSTDRKQTLLHYLVKVIAEKYPQLTGFHSDLHFLDKAGSGMGWGADTGWERARGAQNVMGQECCLSDSLLLYCPTQCPWTACWGMSAPCSEAWS